MNILPNLVANWPAPSNVHALTTTRSPGYSQKSYAHNNLALHVDDDPTHVHANRAALIETLALPTAPSWLEQTHSTVCVTVEDESNRYADAAVTRQSGQPLAILTADCLPIVLCDKQGTEVAAIHAGWRGLMNGIIENTLTKMKSPSNQLMAWIGLAICLSCYETGLEVKQAFTERYAFTQQAFQHRDGRLYADLPKMAELVLHTLGVSSVYQSGACTFESENAFYSYRREAQTGRIATLIWFTT